MLKEIEVPIEDLLLDPNNPRFICDLNEVAKIPDENIEAKQADTLKKFSRTDAKDPDFDVTNIGDLYESLLRIGYVGIDRIVVRRIAGSKKYLVLEGNRRVATVKSILRDYENKLPPLVRPQERAAVDEHRLSFDKITAKLLDTKGLSSAEIERRVAILLGIRHHGSLLPWEPLPRAFNIYTEYMTEPPQQDGFEFANKKAREVANRLCIQRTDVADALRTYVAYLELRQRFPAIQDEHYSLIESGIKDRHLQAGYFKIDDITFVPDEQSLTKLNKVCQFATRDSNNSEYTKNDKKKILRDPKQFKQLAKLVDKMQKAKHPAIKSYAADLIARVEDEDDPDMTVDQAVDDLTAFENRTKWASAVGKLLDKQEEDLLIEKYAGDGSDRGYKDELKKTMERLQKLI